ncbi:MAG: type II toxin-antitoxin system RelE/ParE family toxin [Ignavibacteriales bacterium]|nr:type II toxin-antitoxin system RelE/ParE family toxin [Ignavibacteriales bacterium]
MRSIEFYRTSSGACPLEEFLDSLSDQQAQKVAWVLRLVERLERVPEQYLKKLAGTDQLWEIRIQGGGKSYRLLGFFDGPVLMVLTSGFVKKRQKTPRQEIELAQRRRNEYLERKGRR